MWCCPLKLLLLIAVFFSHVTEIPGYNVSDINTNDGVSPVAPNSPESAFLKYFFHGAPGKDGRDGRDGRDGKAGKRGPRGFPGSACSPEMAHRTVGPAGAPGKDGQPGADGASGPIGPPGPASRPGKIGPQGLEGPPGPSWPSGPPGPIGLSGPRGPTGLSGPLGPTGPKGSSGPPGPNGLTGPRGRSGPRGPPGPETVNPYTSGAVYVRWGRTTCPSSSDLVYKGLVGGTWYNDNGGGSNYLCLPLTPEYDEYQSGTNNHRAYIYSAEYETSAFPPLNSKHNHDVPCAVCRARNRGSMVMIPAKMNCPSGWMREYYGYLMTEERDRHRQRRDFACMDRLPEVVSGSGGNQNGALFYQVEGRCDRGNLPCSSYVNGHELTCVVCTK